MIEESDEEAEAQQGNEWKTHGRKRSQTNTSGHTADSLSSRGDIFPSEDELDDAVPLDDEFAVALERRTTGQWHDDTSSGKSKSKRPSASRISTKSASSRNTQDSGRRSQDTGPKRQPSEPISEMPSLSDLKQEEEQLRLEEETEVERKRQEAQHLAVKRGLAASSSAAQHLQVPRRRTPSPNTAASPQYSSRQSVAETSPFILRDAREADAVDSQTMPDSSAFHVDESDVSSFAPSSRPSSLKDVEREEFVPAMLPHFSAQPG